MSREFRTLVCVVGGFLCAYCVSRPLVARGSEAKQTLSQSEAEKVFGEIKSAIKKNGEHTDVLSATYDGVDSFAFPGHVPEQVKSAKTPSSNDMAGYASRLPTRPERYWEVKPVKLKVIWDNHGQRAQVRYVQVGPTVVVDSTHPGVREWEHSDSTTSWIFTPEHFIELEETHRLGQISQFPTVPWIPPSGGRVAYRSASYDKYISIKPTSPLEWNKDGREEFASLCDRWVEEGSKRVHTSPSKTLVSYGLAGALPKRVFQMALESATTGSALRWTFDESQGWQCTHQQVFVKGKVVREYTIRFDQFEGQTIPVQYDCSKSVNDGKGTSNLIVDRHFKMDRKTLAKARSDVSEAEFDVKALHLRYGDRLADKLNNKLYVMGDTGNLIGAESFKPNLDRLWTPAEMANAALLSEASLGSKRLSPSLLINIAIVLGLLCLVLWNRRALVAKR